MTPYPRAPGPDAGTIPGTRPPRALVSPGLTTIRPREPAPLSFFSFFFSSVSSTSAASSTKPVSWLLSAYNSRPPASEGAAGGTLHLMKLENDSRQGTGARCRHVSPWPRRPLSPRGRPTSRSASRCSTAGRARPPRWPTSTRMAASTSSPARTGMRRPAWTKHKFRELDFSGNYIDGFSDLPVDVDGDGYPDIASVTWFAKKISWVRNPGKGGRLGRGANQRRLQHRVRDTRRHRQRRQDERNRGAGERHRPVVVRGQYGSGLGARDSGLGSESGAPVPTRLLGKARGQRPQLRPRHRLRRRQQGRPQRHPDTARLARGAGRSARSRQLDLSRRRGSR